jgi:lysyl-tRNA synthetase class 2
MPPRSHEPPDWRPTADLTVLEDRAAILATTRRFFEERGYWEVETPLLSADVCVDAWIDPIAVPDPRDPGRRLFLQTSPEFAMKRLLCAGADSIYQITRSFRRGESGPRHNIEFTIVEWYRVGDSLQDQMTLTEDLVRSVAACDVGIAARELPSTGFPRLTYEEAFTAATGEGVLDKSGPELRRLADAHGLAAPSSLTDADLDGWRNLLLAELVEPMLAREPALFLHDYPASQAALAEIRRGPPDVAQRFELYLGGVEICNGYYELTDPEELHRRMRRHNEVRVASGESPLPAESRLIEAMHSGLPACSGTALGFDRLAMWRLGHNRIQDVIAFPIDRS